MVFGFRRLVFMTECPESNLPSFRLKAQKSNKLICGMIRELSGITSGNH